MTIRELLADGIPMDDELIIQDNDGNSYSIMGAVPHAGAPEDKTSVLVVEEF